MGEAESLRTCAWVGPAGRRAALAGAELRRFRDSDAFLLSPDPYGHGAYVVEDGQTGVGGLDLLRLVRRASAAPVVFLSATPDAHFVAALEAGADMVLPIDAPKPHVEAALASLLRRRQPARRGHWTLDAAREVLVAPEGGRVTVNGTDLTILQCFAQAGGQVLGRDELMLALWGRTDEALHNALHATVYRLRRRIRDAGGEVPLQAVAGVGYVFRGRLELA
jgi:DNA-binding response OmpR family regulator